MQERLDLSGRWGILFDSDNQGVVRGWHLGRWPEGGEQSIEVPSVWNTIRPGYAGPAFYRARFTSNPEWKGSSVRLRIGAANYLTQAWLNGVYLGQHEGGYTPFDFDLSGPLRFGEGNELIVRVLSLPPTGEIDGLSLAQVPCSKETWYYGHGGIWGAVEVLVEPQIRCSDLFVEPDVEWERVCVHLQMINGTDAPAETQVEVRVFAPGDAEVGSASTEVLLPPERSEHEFWIPILDPMLWSVSDPNLYRCRVIVRAQGYGEHVVETTFGMRSFTMRDGEFLLNGRPIFLRGTLYQPNYPVTLLYPPHPEWPEREMQRIKQAGFNLVRSHIRPACPEYLDIADRIGLLIYEETSLAWIERTPRLYEHGERELREMILRDRNHPSIVIWGIFNENLLSNSRAGFHLLDYARSLDATRVVIDNSGGSLALGHDFGWVHQTHVQLPGKDHAQMEQDIHVYVGAPVNQSLERWLRTLGKYPPEVDIAAQHYYRPEPVRWYHEQLRDWRGRIFVSELGYGGICDLESVTAAYQGKEHLLDAEEMLALRDSLDEGAKRRGLDHIFGGLAGIARAAQEIQVEGNSRQLNALLANPRISGYCHTQFNDVGWECHAGIVDIWRRPKALCHAMRQINEPHHLISRLNRYAVCPDESVELDLDILHEVPLAGPDEIRVELYGAEGAQVWQHEQLVIPRGRLTNVTPCEIPPLGETGEYRVAVHLSCEGSRLSMVEERFLVLSRVDLAALRGRFSLAYADEALRRLFPEVPVGMPQDGRWLVLPNPELPTLREWERALSWVEAGGRMIVGPLTPEHDRALASFARYGQRISTEGTIGAWMGHYHYIKSSPTFAGLPVDGLAGQPYAEVIPWYSLNELSDRVWAGTFRNHLKYRGEPYGFTWYADVQQMPMGSGQILFCQYRIWDRIGTDPIADRLFANIITSDDGG